jgi:hypothetical protein
MYRRLIEQHESLLQFLENLGKSREAPQPSMLAIQPPQPPARQLPLDLADLPEELLSELSEGTVKGEADPVLQIIDDHGGTASIDEILIDLYRKHGEIGKRTIVGSRLYRLSKRGLVRAMPGKKGIYTTMAAGPRSSLSGPVPS